MGTTKGETFFPSKNLLLLVVIVFSWEIGAHAASFDCGKAVTVIDKTICAERELSNLDDTLTRSYKDALAKSRQKDVLKSEQRAWLTNVRNKCGDTTCLKRVYRERITAIDSLIGAKPDLPRDVQAQGDIRYHSFPVRNTKILFPKLVHFKDKTVMNKINHQIDELTKGFGCDDGSTKPSTTKTTDEFSVKSSVTYAENDVFSIYASAQYFCGGSPYPTNDANISATFDLRTGKKVEFKDLFTNYAANENEVLKIIAERLTASLTTGGGNRDSDSCRDIYSIEHLKESDFAFNFSKVGLRVQPLWPHAIEACAELVTVPYRKLIKYAPPDGLLSRIGK